MKDKINPDHYKRGGIECIQISEQMNFNLGNVIKYVFRCDEKGGITDLEKAQWYLNRELLRRKNE